MIPAPKMDATPAAQPAKQTAVFAGGCFWGVQSVFQRVRGVLKTTAGYAGGTKETATYKQVITETTDHAESVEVVFDPAKITYGQLLRIYFSVAHDPTQLNRQGPDAGKSYRSEIFYTSEEQHKLATAYIAQLDQQRVPSEADRHACFVAKDVLPRGRLSPRLAPITTPTIPYIQVCEVPKIIRIREQYPEPVRGIQAKNSGGHRR